MFVRLPRPESGDILTFDGVEFPVAGLSNEVDSAFIDITEVITADGKFLFYRESDAHQDFQGQDVIYRQVRVPRIYMNTTEFRNRPPRPERID